MSTRPFRFCRGEVRFRTIRGRVTPFHDGDDNCPTRAGNGQPDQCRLTTCPVCSQNVYFVRHNGGAVWFDELGKPWDKHACFIPEDFHSAPAISGLDPIFLVRVRDVRPLMKESGYALYFGRDGRASDIIDILIDDTIESPPRYPKPPRELMLLKRRWIYIDYSRSRVITLDGWEYRFRSHVFLVGWKQR